ncbi:hypothetical protein Tco_0753718 [Tanacetum coccineum]
MKLDLSECAFGMEAGKFLGYVATTEGIKSNPEKVKVILRSTTPKGEQVLQTLYKSNEGTSGSKKEPQEELTPMPRAWRLYVGRESNKEGLEDNMDYEALLARLVASTGRGMKDLHVFVDSKCLVDCVKGIGCQEQKNQRGRKPKIGNTNMVSINLTRSLNQEVSVGVKTRPSVEVQDKHQKKIGNVSKKAASGRSSPTWEDHSESN